MPAHANLSTPAQCAGLVARSRLAPDSLARSHAQNDDCQHTHGNIIVSACKLAMDGLSLIDEALKTLPRTSAFLALDECAL